MSEVFQDPLLPKITRFMKRHGLSATAFGQHIAKDRNFVKQLGDGRELRRKTRAAVLARMQAYAEGQSQ